MLNKGSTWSSQLDPIQLDKHSIKNLQQKFLAGAIITNSIISTAHTLARIMTTMSCLNFQGHACRLVCKQQSELRISHFKFWAPGNHPSPPSLETPLRILEVISWRREVELLRVRRPPSAELPLSPLLLNSLSAMLWSGCRVPVLGTA